jgi:AraC-like DNA-binding protein
MPATGKATYTDPGDYQAGLCGAAINLVFTRPGIFAARVTSLRLRHLQLLSVKESLPRVAYVTMAPGSVNIAFPTHFEPPPIWGGLEMKSLDLMLHSFGERLHQRTSGANGWGLISVDPEFFASFTKALTGSELIPPGVGRVFRPLRVDAVELRRLHANACRLAETKPKATSHQEVARAIEHDIVCVLVNCLTAGIAHEDTAIRQRNATIMNKFEDALAAKFDRQLTIPKVCRDIGVAERTLRMRCFDVLGMSPNQYIRLRRLNLVHVALRHADPATAKVSEIAAQYGFSEMGRFAGFYRTIFGEMPSVILRRPRPEIHDLQFAESI